MLCTLRRTVLAGTLAASLVAFMVSLVPIAGALDDPLAEVVETTAVPAPEPTPLPEPLEEVVEEVEKVVGETAETVDNTVKDVTDPEPEPPPSPQPRPDPPPDPEPAPAPKPPPAPGTTAPAKVVETVDRTVQETITFVEETTTVITEAAAVSDETVGVVEQAVARFERGRTFDELPLWRWLDAADLALLQPAPQPAILTTGIPWLNSVHGLPAGPRNTSDIVGALQGLGLSTEEIGCLLAPFPVAGLASYSADFGAPRDGGERWHMGTDVFAERGTPVIATADGTVSNVRHDVGLGGNSLRLTVPDGTYYYYAHLDGFAPGIVSGTEVSKCDVLGYVGNTGNAIATPPHLHFQIHPGGGAAVNPLPYLDRWLAEARDTVRALTASPEVQPPRVAPPSDPTPEARAVEGELPARAGLVGGDPTADSGLGVGLVAAVAIALLLALVHAAPAMTAGRPPD